MTLLIEQLLSSAHDIDPSMDELAEFLGASAEPTTDAAAALFAMFDAAVANHRDLVIFESDHPDAPESLRAWASSKNRLVVDWNLGSGLRMLTVTMAGASRAEDRRIEVHLRPEGPW